MQERPDTTSLEDYYSNGLVEGEDYFYGGFTAALRSNESLGYSAQGATSPQEWLAKQRELKKFEKPLSFDVVFGIGVGSIFGVLELIELRDEGAGESLEEFIGIDASPTAILFGKLLISLLKDVATGHRTMADILLIFFGTDCWEESSLSLLTSEAKSVSLEDVKNPSMLFEMLDKVAGQQPVGLREVLVRDARELRESPYTLGWLRGEHRSINLEEFMYQENRFDKGISVATILYKHRDSLVKMAQEDKLAFELGNVKNPKFLEALAVRYPELTRQKKVMYYSNVLDHLRESNDPHPNYQELTSHIGNPSDVHVHTQKYSSMDASAYEWILSEDPPSY